MLEQAATLNEHRPEIKLGSARFVVHEQFTKRMGRLISCIAFTLAVCSGGGQSAKTQTTQDFSRSSDQDQASLQKTAATEIYVDGTRGSDFYPGTREQPVKAIGKAIQLARVYNICNIPTRILINAGIYREAAVWVASGRETEAPITIMASKSGTVTISGSDVWVDWQPDRQNPNLLIHHWPYLWGLCPLPRGWPVVQDIVRRREMIFVNEELLKQVLSLGDMQVGSYFVDELNARVYIWVPRGTNIQTATIEVAVRPELLRFQGKSNLALRGLKFVHANTCFSRAAVAIFEGSNNLVEDSAFTWNNWTGLLHGGSLNATARQIVANHNGGAGMEAYALNHAVYGDVEVSDNNWRGALGNFYGWAVAGAKLGRIHGGSFTRIKAIGNHTRGIWFDFDNRDIVVDHLFTAQNDRDGIFLEASQGPITIMNSRICGNGTEGVLTSNSSWVKLKGNVIYGNKKSQIFVWGEPEGRRVEDRETHAQYTLLAEHWTINQTVIMGLNSTAALIGTHQTARNWNVFLTSLTSDQNTWYSPSPQSAFQLGVENGGGPPKLADFAGWRRATGQDKDSFFGRPVIDPATACAAL